MSLCTPNTSSMGNYIVVASDAALPGAGARFPGLLAFVASTQTFKWWNGATWVDLAVGGGGGGGGATTLGQLTDVADAAPVDTAFLRYNAGTAVWSGTRLVDDPTITSITGDIAELQAALSAISTQSSVVDLKGLAASQYNSRNVYTDLYAAEPTDTRNTGDQLTWANTQYLENNQPTGTKNVTVSTTNGSSNVVITSGTIASTDEGRQIAAAGIPGATYLTFTDSTHLTLRDVSGTAVTATATASVAATITSPDVSFGLLFKVGGNNYMNSSVTLPAGPGIYVARFEIVWVQGATDTACTREATWTISNLGAGTNSSPIVGSRDSLHWLTNTSTASGTTRQAFEHRLTPGLKAPGVGVTRQWSGMFSTRNVI